MKPTLLELISTGKTLVSDGACGTFLQAKGLQPGDCPEQWNIDHQDAVLNIARGYNSFCLFCTKLLHLLNYNIFIGKITSY